MSRINSSVLGSQHEEPDAGIFFLVSVISKIIGGSLNNTVALNVSVFFFFFECISFYQIGEHKDLGVKKGPWANHRLYPICQDIAVTKQDEAMK